MVLKSFSNAVLPTTVKLASNGMTERQRSEEFRLFREENLIHSFNVRTLNSPERSEGKHRTGNVRINVILRSVLATFVAAEKK